MLESFIYICHITGIQGTNRGFKKTRTYTWKNHQYSPYNFGVSAGQNSYTSGTWRKYRGKSACHGADKVPRNQLDSEKYMDRYFINTKSTADNLLFCICIGISGPGVLQRIIWKGRQAYENSRISKAKVEGSAAAVGGKTQNQIKHYCHLVFCSPLLNRYKNKRPGTKKVKKGVDKPGHKC